HPAAGVRAAPLSGCRSEDSIDAQGTRASLTWQRLANRRQPALQLCEICRAEAENKAREGFLAQVVPTQRVNAHMLLRQLICHGFEIPGLARDCADMHAVDRRYGRERRGEVPRERCQYELSSLCIDRAHLADMSAQVTFGHECCHAQLNRCGAMPVEAVFGRD